MIVHTKDIHFHTVNISWSSLSQSIYSLIIVTSNKTCTAQPQILQLHQPYYVFIAPEGAPPCEVYNFSVTATYVGATYTGAGCSVPSPVLSRMLPALPDQRILESTLDFSLERQKTGDITLRLFIVST